MVFSCGLAVSDSVDVPVSQFVASDMFFTSLYFKYYIKYFDKLPRPLLAKYLQNTNKFLQREKHGTLILLHIVVCAMCAYSSPY